MAASRPTATDETKPVVGAARTIVKSQTRMGPRRSPSSMPRKAAAEVEMPVPTPYIVPSMQPPTKGIKKPKRREPTKTWMPKATMWGRRRLQFSEGRRKRRRLSKAPARCRA